MILGRDGGGEVVECAQPLDPFHRGALHFRKTKTFKVPCRQWPAVPHILQRGSSARERHMNIFYKSLLDL